MAKHKNKPEVNTKDSYPEFAGLKYPEIKAAQMYRDGSRFMWDVTVYSRATGGDVHITIELEPGIESLFFDRVRRGVYDMVKRNRNVSGRSHNKSRKDFYGKMRA